jgi:transposase
VANHPTLLTITGELLQARAALAEQFIQLDKQLRVIACSDNRARLLTTVPGVGSIVALTFAPAIDDPPRFKSSKTVGALFDLTPKKYQSGETDVTGPISKIGDAGVRTALSEAANVILTRTLEGSSLKK